MVVFPADAMGHANRYFTKFIHTITTNVPCRKGILSFDFGVMLSCFCTS